MTAFTVAGIPVTQGSKRAFVNKRTGRAVIVEGGGQAHKDWRAVVQHAAQVAHNGAALYDGPVVASLAFTLPRPAAHYGSGRNAGTVKASAPSHPIGAHSGDVDKLARSVLDSLTGVVFADDSQVANLTITKDYGAPGVAVIVLPWCWGARRGQQEGGSDGD